MYTTLAADEDGAVSAAALPRNGGRQLRIQGPDEALIQASDDQR